MAEPLPLCVNRVNRTAWKETLSDEPLPVNLVLVFLTWVLLCHLEDLNQFPHREPGPLVGCRVILDLQ